jgi:tricorn protease
MKKTTSVLLAMFFCVVAVGTAGEARFMRYPTVSGDRIVFTYEGDLWSVGVAGGPAARLTTHPGVETFARFSPDGKWLAFTASYDGPQAVYVMPAEGGEPKRLTYNPPSAQVVGWTPDGTRVVFRSMFENVIGRDPNLYFVGIGGTAPERFPLDRGVLCSFSPDGKRMLYCRRGYEEYYWKRYKGGQYQDIWMYDWTVRKATPVTDYVGKNSYPMWIGDRMVFVSDRGNGISNLYTQALGAKDARPLTAYADFDVMMPSTDGRSIVYVQDGHVHILDAGSGRDAKVAVTVPSDRWTLRPRTINPKDYIHAVDVANDGRTVILEARGDVFTVPTEKGPARNLSNTAGTREMYPAVSPDGRTVAFFSDRTGDYQLYTQPVEGGEWTAITTGLDRFVYHLAWSPDGGKILFGNKDFSISYVDVATKKMVQVDSSNQMKNDEFYWEISDYGWSPDGNWICYSLVQANRNSRIFLYSLADGKRSPVTDDFYDNINPCFDAGGDYLYYLSSRNFDVQMDFYEDDHVISAPQQIMAVQLRAGEAPPFGDAPAPAEPGKADVKAPLRPFRIDVEGLALRTYPVPVEPGNFFFLRAGKGKAVWCSVERFTEDEYEEIFKPRGGTKWNLHVFDTASKKAAVLGDKVREFGLSANGERAVIRKDNDIFVTTVDEAFKAKGLGEKLDLQGLTYVADPRAEWGQIFTDAWRWYRDFFYDAGFHGRDWTAMGEKYRAYLPALSSRDELNWVLSQMVGELCVSHTYVGGGDPGPQGPPQESPVFTGLLGADLVADKASGLYRFEKIYGPNTINLNLRGPLVGPDKDVGEGDYLLAVNGRAVRPPEDYFRLLQTTPGRKVSVTINSKPTAAGAKTFEVEPLQNDRQLRYFRWLGDNVDKVLKATGGRVGYMHINAMGSGGIAEFDKFWRAFRYKEGVIIDVRRNSGGWTEYFLIDKLERVLDSYNVLRGMVPFRYPGSAGNGNYVVISNENNGSDGEAFVEHFKSRKLGTVVGVPSWGGLVGILNRQLTIDNGSVEQSNNAFYGRGGTWLVENHGADPDILVDNDPDSVMAGRDLQLEKAIEAMMEKIKANPLVFPPRPDYPKK